MTLASGSRIPSHHVRSDSWERQNDPDSRPATAQDQGAEVVTGDADLKDLPGVGYIK